MVNFRASLSTSDETLGASLSVNDEDLTARLQNNNDVDLRATLNAIVTSSGGEGTRDYNLLYNKPKIESVMLSGNKTFSDLGLDAMSYMDINSIVT